MDITVLENNLKAGKLNSVYLLYGEERFLLDNSVKRIKKLFGEMINGINYIQIDSSNVSEIVADIETPAFGYPKKLIIAKDTGLFQKAKRGKSTATQAETKSKKDENKLENKLAAYLEENIDLINDSVILIFIENEAEKKVLIRAIGRLSGREQMIIRMRFGLGTEDGEEKTQKEVADMLGISQSYISRLEKKIMQRLRREMVKYS